MILYGFHYSVYVRTVRMALHMKSIDYTLEEIDPFEAEGQQRLLALHPFGRVPALEVDGFGIYETQAILDYLEAVRPAPALQPVEPRAVARMRQVMSIADNYVYWPLVRQAASEHVFHPLLGEPKDEVAFAAGLETTPPVLDALEALAAEGRVLVPGEITMADCHLWPMMDYALMVPEIADLLSERACLAAWAESMGGCRAAEATTPNMEALAGDA